jgi:hypothetical protein
VVRRDAQIETREVACSARTASARSRCPRVAAGNCALGFVDADHEIHA